MRLAFEIPVTRAADATLTLAELHARVWEQLRVDMRRLLRRAGNAVVTADYLPAAAEDGLHGDPHQRWDRSETSLGFGFRDGGETSLGMWAAVHWVEMAYLANARALGGGGWTVAAPARPLETALAIGPPLPFAYPRGGMVAVARRERGQPLDGARARRDRDREVIDFCALTGHCQCDLCAHYRLRAVPRSLRYTVAGAIGPARRAWELLEAGEAASAALEAQAAAAVHAWSWTDPAGPPELGGLREWLAAREVYLPAHLLAGIVASRARTGP